MIKLTDKVSKIDDNKKYFWSPVVQWKILNNNLIINEDEYDGIYKKLFPELYYCMQDGVTINEMINKFNGIAPQNIREFMRLLIKKRVLVSNILTPQEIFHQQNIMFSSNYTEEDFFDKDKLQQFKNIQLNRSLYGELQDTIQLSCKDYPDFIVSRRTARKFDKTRKIDKDIFEKIISVFNQNKNQNEIYYNYASAGGLYPIDIYLYIKDNRLEEIKGGLYYYSPIKKSIVLISDSCVITKDAHLLNNKNIFEESAFSMFFVYNAEVTMPKYGGLAYYYACIDTGIMIGLLSVVAELSGVGLCSIGNMNFKKIKKYFKLSKNQVLLHSVELGLKVK